VDIAVASSASAMSTWIAAMSSKFTGADSFTTDSPISGSGVAWESGTSAETTTRRCGWRSSSPMANRWMDAIAASSNATASISSWSPEVKNSCSASVAANAQPLRAWIRRLSSSAASMPKVAGM